MSWSWPLVAGAACALFCGHLVRALRQALLFDEGRRPGRLSRLVGLTVSYLVNTVAPLRIGEAARIAFLSAQGRLPLPYVAATVAAERVADLCAAALVFVGLAVAAGGAPGPMAVGAAMAAAGLAGLGLAAALAHSPLARRLLWTASWPLNPQLRAGVLDLAWSYAQLVSQRHLFSRAFVAASLVMWALYLSAYALFAQAVGGSFAAVAAALLGFQAVRTGGAALIVFTTAPLAAILGYAAYRGRGRLSLSRRWAERFHLSGADRDRLIVGERFRRADDYAAFLQAHFSGQAQLVSRFAVAGMEGATTHRILPGGSDAVTALVEVEDGLRIRKFAAGDAAAKLRTQVRWLEDHAALLPLARVVEAADQGDGHRYDMPFLPSAREFYQVIHTAPAAVAEGVLTGVFHQLGAFHAIHDRGDASEAAIDAYLTEKVIRNARLVGDFARGVLGAEVYQVNGEAHAFADWNLLTDLGWLRAQVSTRRTSVIHGDLTVENIIVCDGCPNGWYLIDPNPENLFDSPLIDWAKLMQSLSLGYEGLSRGGQAQVRGAAIDVAIVRSQAYAALHARFSEMLAARFGRPVLREVAFHEIVNYLRLIPYRMRRDPAQAITFFACASLLLRQYRLAEPRRPRRLAV